MHVNGAKVNDSYKIGMRHFEVNSSNQSISIEVHLFRCYHTHLFSRKDL